MRHSPGCCSAEGPSDPLAVCRVRLPGGSCAQGRGGSGDLGDRPVGGGAGGAHRMVVRVGVGGGFLDVAERYACVERGGDGSDVLGQSGAASDLAGAVAVEPDRSG